jgi:hypothetical protein
MPGMIAGTLLEPPVMGTPPSMYPDPEAAGGQAARVIPH